jgi:diacylglycerol O-acyltransferase
VSTRDEFSALRANSVSNMFTVVPVQIDDPIRRLRLVHDVTEAAKEQHRLLGPQMLADWSELSPPAPFTGVVRAYSKLRLAEHHRPPINLVVSNVPGPTTALSIAGARLLSISSMGPLLENIGLNITVWSYLDDMSFGIVGVPEHVPDLRRLADHLHDALTELRKAAAARAP